MLSLNLNVPGRNGEGSCHAASGEGQVCPCDDTPKNRTLLGSLRQSFCDCANCAGSGVGGALLSHSGCAAALLLGGASGMALSMRMMSVMIYTSPVLAAGMTAAIDYIRTRKVSLPRMAISGVIGVGMTIGVHYYATHDMHHGSDGTHHRHRMPDGTMMDGDAMKTMAIPVQKPASGEFQP